MQELYKNVYLLQTVCRCLPSRYKYYAPAKISALKYQQCKKMSKKNKRLVFSTKRDKTLQSLIYKIIYKNTTWSLKLIYDMSADSGGGYPTSGVQIWHSITRSHKHRRKDNQNLQVASPVSLQTLGSTHHTVNIYIET